MPSPFPCAHQTSIVFAGHGLNLLECSPEIFLRYEVTRKFLSDFEGWTNLSIHELFTKPELLNSSALYQRYKFTLDMAYLAGLKLELGLELHEIATYLWGMSLGEVEALAAAGTWEFSQAFGILGQRGKLIEEHQPKGEWSVHALIGTVRDAVESIIDSIKTRRSTATMHITNHNGEKVVVVSGKKIDLETLSRALKAQRLRVDIRPLDLGNIFHHPSLEAAAYKFEEVIRRSMPRMPKPYVLSNVTGKTHESADDIPHLLGRHLISPVEFVKNRDYLVGCGIKHVIVIGHPGPLSTLLNKKFEKIFVVDSIASIREVAQELRLLLAA